MRNKINYSGMDEVKFTPLPWEVKPLEPEKNYIRIRGTILGRKFKICNVVDEHYHHMPEQMWCKREREEALANAYLIAAAPEMYEQLNSLSDLYLVMNKQTQNLDAPINSITNEVVPLNELNSGIKKLLAKARGEFEEQQNG